MESKVSIVWFRNDLRLHDNEAFYEASASSEKVVPVYIFDERIFKGQTKFGFPKTGKFRTKFIIESVVDLRENLRSKGSDLLVFSGKPEDILVELARQLKASWIFCNRERTQEEVDVQDKLEKLLWSFGREIRYSRGKMLYYTSDLPFPVTHTPDFFTSFRKEVEKYIPIRLPLTEANFKFSDLSEIEDKGQIPVLEDFGFDDFEIEKGMNFHGGETEALAQLDYYFEETELALKYKETRNGLLGRDFSTKFSCWLSNGCLSPKMVYQRLKDFEKSKGANQSTYWIFFELLWRDFFRLMGKKHGNRIFQLSGLTEKAENDHVDWDTFKKWSEGETGVPFIDANMKELNATGFMSNRGRQNTASFLVKDLNINWLMGAEYFESLLIDYDPCSNYGNWNYIAGVGSDPREDRYFNILSQAKKYDPKGAYVRYWLPQLAALPDSVIHTPDRLSNEQKSQFHFEVEKAYCPSLVDSTKWG